MLQIHLISDLCGPDTYHLCEKRGDMVTPLQELSQAHAEKLMVREGVGYVRVFKPVKNN